MADKREVVFVSAVRTAIGDYGGTLKDFAPTDLAARVAKEAVARAKLDPAQVGHVVFGNVIHTEAKDMYLSRVAMINAGIPKETPALTLNRLCGSGFQSIVSAANVIMLGDADAALAGGAESMSRGGYLLPTARWGTRMNDGKIVDMMVGALTDPFDTIHMGVTAENVAARHGITREMQDAFAVESHKRAAAATAAGHFKDQILPIDIQSKKELIETIDTDNKLIAPNETTSETTTTTEAFQGDDPGAVVNTGLDVNAVATPVTGNVTGVGSSTSMSSVR